MMPATSGQTAQVPTILVSVAVSVAAPLNRFQPMMAPTMAWVVDTGRPARVMA